jgi:hypothetical protein
MNNLRGKFTAPLWGAWLLLLTVPRVPLRSTLGYYRPLPPGVRGVLMGFVVSHPFARKARSRSFDSLRSLRVCDFFEFMRFLSA